VRERNAARSRKKDTHGLNQSSTAHDMLLGIPAFPALVLGAAMLNNHAAHSPPYST
jgi:hypothetical protein